MAFSSHDNHGTQTYTNPTNNQQTYNQQTYNQPTYNQQTYNTTNNQQTYQRQINNYIQKHNKETKNIIHEFVRANFTNETGNDTQHFEQDGALMVNCISRFYTNTNKLESKWKVLCSENEKVSFIKQELINLSISQKQNTKSLDVRKLLRDVFKQFRKERKKMRKYENKNSESIAITSITLIIEEIGYEFIDIKNLSTDAINLQNYVFVYGDNKLYFDAYFGWNINLNPNGAIRIILGQKSDCKLQGLLGKWNEKYLLWSDFNEALNLKAKFMVIYNKNNDEFVTKKQIMFNNNKAAQFNELLDENETKNEENESHFVPDLNGINIKVSGCDDQLEDEYYNDICYDDY